MENEKEKFVIISDSSCDLPPEQAAENRITVVPFYVSFDSATYQKEGVELSVRAFYQQMVDAPKVYPKSSMPSVQDYRRVFAEYAKQGQPVLCICITTKFSGSMQSALNAAELVQDEYPDAEIEVMDATVNTVLQGLFVMQAVALRDRGDSLTQAVARLNEIKSTGRIFFTVGDISYLAAGGRIGKVAAMAGGLLGVKPVIVLKEGEIFLGGMGRARAKNLQKCLDLLQDYAKDEVDLKNCELVVGYGYDRAEAEGFRDQLSEVVKPLGYTGEIPLWQIGAAIGVHTGPYPLGLAVVEKG